jgi:hypothetical protein
MVKYSVLSFIFIVLSCNCNKGYFNEFGRKRDNFNFNNEEIFTNNYLNIYDTTIIYIKKGYLFANKYFHNEDNNTYLKFYSNNKVGKFYNINELSFETFDPKKSSMGFCFQDINNKNYIQFWVNGECNYMIKRYLFLRKARNQIYLYDCLNSKKDSIIEIYESVTLKSDFLKNRKPDW